MKALQYTTYGGPEVLGIADVAEPHPGPGQVRIKVRAAAVNPIDWKLLSGRLSGKPAPDKPVIPGFEAAGVVDEVGEGVEGVSVGDDVFGLGVSGQAEYALLRSWARKPASVDWAVAGGASIAAEAAERVLRLLQVEAGQTLFIDGATGGVGSTASQIAVARGITVVGSTSEDNFDYLREIGGIPVLYGEGVDARVLDAVEEVHAVLDAAGKTPVEVLVGLAPAPSNVVSIANFGAGSAGVIVTDGSTDAEPVKALAEAADLLEHSKLVIKIQTFPLERAAEAYELIQTGHVRGKLVLLP